MRHLVIYGRPGCPQCAATCRKAEALGLAFDYHDVELEEDLGERLRRDGWRSLPVVETGHESWSGYRPDLLEKLV